LIKKLGVYSWNWATRPSRLRVSLKRGTWKIPVADGLTPEEVEQTMKFVANEHDMSNVGELPLSNDIAAKSGEGYPVCQNLSLL
jgi:hypothetical protein